MGTKFKPLRVGMMNGMNASQIYVVQDVPLHEENAVATVFGIPLHTAVKDVGPMYRDGMVMARLLAAAPDLYAACESAANLLRKLGGTNHDPEYSELVNALAKARNE